MSSAALRSVCNCDQTEYFRIKCSELQCQLNVSLSILLATFLSDVLHRVLRQKQN